MLFLIDMFDKTGKSLIEHPEERLCICEGVVFRNWAGLGDYEEVYDMVVNLVLGDESDCIIAGEHYLDSNFPTLVPDYPEISEVSFEICDGDTREHSRVTVNELLNVFESGVDNFCKASKLDDKVFEIFIMPPVLYDLIGNISLSGFSDLEYLLDDLYRHSVKEFKVEDNSLIISGNMNSYILIDGTDIRDLKRRLLMWGLSRNKEIKD